jgi:hypothetical protein
MIAPPFAIRFVEAAIGHLKSIEAKYHGLLEAKIDEQLSHQPNVPARNRKPLRLPAPFEAAWELRCGPQNRFRVFYSLDLRVRTVTVLGICVKDGNRLICGGEEVSP